MAKKIAFLASTTDEATTALAELVRVYGNTEPENAEYVVGTSQKRDVAPKTTFTLLLMRHFCQQRQFKESKFVQLYQLCLENVRLKVALISLKYTQRIVHISLRYDKNKFCVFGQALAAWGARGRLDSCTADEFCSHPTEIACFAEFHALKIMCTTVYNKSCFRVVK